MVYAQPSSYPGEWHTNSYGTLTYKRIFSARRPDLIIINKKRENDAIIVDFAVPDDHRIKLKESEKKDEYINLTWELKINYETWRWRLYQSWLV